MNRDAVAGYLELTRPVNSLVAGVLTLIGSFVAGGIVTQPLHAGAAVVATWLATAAGNAINDYFDRDVDRINNPERPIPRGSVEPRGALVFSALLFVVAVGFVLTLPLIAIGIATINLLGLIAYTEVFKGLPGAGNALVAYLGGSTFLFGAAAVGAVLDGVVLFVLAALSTFSREVIKDVEDVVGDEEEGLSTLPIAIGERNALWVSVVALVGAVLASPFPYLWNLFGLSYLVLVIPADAIMLWAARRSFSDPTTGQTWLKYGMFLAASAFIVGRVSLILQ
ncbi:MAG: geranylgeranylglycerol-phosphate geranylgeranyltransferase [Halodesulfurarchaeum sp.]